MKDLRDKIIDIIEEAQDEFMGVNESNLHAAERIAGIVDYWRQRCYLSERLVLTTPIDIDAYQKSSAPYHKNELKDFLKNNVEPFTTVAGNAEEK